MSARFDTATEFLSNAGSGKGTLGDAFTVMAWVYLVSDQSVPSAFFRIMTSSFTGFIVRTAADGVTLNAFDANSEANTSGTTLSTATWYHIAATRPSGSPADLTVYLNGVVDITRAISGTAATALSTFELGDGSYGTEAQFFDGRVAECRIWAGTALTSGEIATEMGSATAVKASPWVDSNFVSDLTDQSGNGRDWTANGSISFEADPPHGGGGGGGHPWYAYAQQRAQTRIERRWERRGVLWQPAYSLRRAA